jgi:phosphohistidine phosphatase
MDLILWRHAEAEDMQTGMSDSSRQLTPKGRRQAERMAAWLNAELPRNTRIVVSPAARTLQTAEALDRPFEISDQLACSASPEDHLAVAQWPQNGNVLLVGHQPTLGQVGALLLSGHTLHWEIKKGSVWWLRSVEGGRKPAILRVAVSPGMLDSIAGR